MSYQEEINALIEVLNTQPDLLNETDWIELEAITNKLPDDEQKIWQALSPWLNNHPEINDACENQLNPSSSATLGPGGTKPKSSSSQSPKHPSLLERLKNEITRHKPDNPPKE